jgi:hypothetical protein
VQNLGTEHPQEQIYCPGIALAVYLEVAAHLRQVTGVAAGLLDQTSQRFDYNQSQVGGLWIQYGEAADSESRSRVREILAYYKMHSEVSLEKTPSAAKV